MRPSVGALKHIAAPKPLLNMLKINRRSAQEGYTNTNQVCDKNKKMNAGAPTSDLTQTANTKTKKKHKTNPKHALTVTNSNEHLLKETGAPRKSKQHLLTSQTKKKL